jgi:dTDP-4-dehydrorhamnose 3,5-epimerase-like enzyme
VSHLIDQRGTLDIAELEIEDQFVTKRIYCISGVPKNHSRGAHAHKSLKQIFFAVAGSLELTVTDGATTETVELVAHKEGFFLPAGYWRDLNNFSDDAVCLVLASEHFSEADYIRSYDEYLRWRTNE